MDPISTLGSVVRQIVALAELVESKHRSRVVVRALFCDLFTFRRLLNTVYTLANDVVKHHPACRDGVVEAVGELVKRTSEIIPVVQSLADGADSGFLTTRGITSVIMAPTVETRIANARDEINTLIGLATFAQVELRGVQAEDAQDAVMRKLRTLLAEQSEASERVVAASSVERRHAFVIPVANIEVIADDASAAKDAGPADSDDEHDMETVVPAYWKRHPEALRSVGAAATAPRGKRGIKNALAAASAGATATAATAASAGATTASSSPPHDPNTMVKFVSLQGTPVFTAWMEALERASADADAIADRFDRRVVALLDQLQAIAGRTGVALMYGVIDRTKLAYDSEGDGPPSPFLAIVMQRYASDVATELGIAGEHAGDDEGRGDRPSTAAASIHSDAAGAGSAAAAAPVPLALRLSYVTQAATTLAQLHKAPRPITHGNLRTAHLLLETGGHRVALTGFGIAALCGAGASAGVGTHTLASTPQAIGADLRAMGCVIVEVLAGARIRRDLEVDAALALLPYDVPEPAREAVRLCWSTEPSPDAMAAIASKLRRAAELAPVATSTAAVTDRPIVDVSAAGGSVPTATPSEPSSPVPDLGYMLILRRLPAPGGSLVYGPAFIHATVEAVANALSATTARSPRVGAGASVSPAGPAGSSLSGVRYTAAELRVPLGGTPTAERIVVRALAEAINASIDAPPPPSLASSHSATPSIIALAGSPTPDSTPRTVGGAGDAVSPWVKLPGRGTTARLIRVSASAGPASPAEAVYAVNAGAACDTAAVSPDAWAPILHAHLLRLALGYMAMFDPTAATAEPRNVAIMLPPHEAAATVDSELRTVLPAYTRGGKFTATTLYARRRTDSDDGAPRLALRLVDIARLCDEPRLRSLAPLAAVGGGGGAGAGVGAGAAFGTEHCLILRDSEGWQGTIDADLLLAAADLLGRNGTAAQSAIVSCGDDGSRPLLSSRQVLPLQLLVPLPTRVYLPLARGAPVPIAALRHLLASTARAASTLVRGPDFVAVIDAVSSYRPISRSAVAAVYRRAASTFPTVSAGAGAGASSGAAAAPVAEAAVRWCLAVRVQPDRGCAMPTTEALAQAVQASITDAASLAARPATSAWGAGSLDWRSTVALAPSRHVEVSIPLSALLRDALARVLRAAAVGELVSSTTNSTTLRVLAAAVQTADGAVHSSSTAAAVARARVRSGFDSAFGVSPLAHDELFHDDERLRITLALHRVPIDADDATAVRQCLATAFSAAFNGEHVAVTVAEDQTPQIRVSMPALMERVGRVLEPRALFVGDAWSTVSFAVQLLVDERKLVSLPAAIGPVVALRAASVTSFDATTPPALILELYDSDSRRCDGSGNWRDWLGNKDNAFSPVPATVNACMDALVREVAAVRQPLPSSTVHVDLPGIALPLPRDADPEAVGDMCRRRQRVAVPLGDGVTATVELDDVVPPDLDGASRPMLTTDPLAPPAPAPAPAPAATGAPAGTAAAPAPVAAPAPPMPLGAAAGAAAALTSTHRTRGIGSSLPPTSPGRDGVAKSLPEVPHLRWHTGNLFDDERRMHMLDGTRDRAVWLKNVPASFFSSIGVKDAAITATACPLPREHPLAWDAAHDAVLYPALGVVELRFKREDDQDGFAKTVAAVRVFADAVDDFGEAVLCEVSLLPMFAFALLPEQLGIVLRAPDNADSWIRWAAARWMDVKVSLCLAGWTHRFGAIVFVAEGVAAAAAVAATPRLEWMDGQAAVLRPYVPPIFAVNLWPHLAANVQAIADAVNAALPVPSAAGRAAAASSVSAVTLLRSDGAAAIVVASLQLRRSLLAKGYMTVSPPPTVAAPTMAAFAPPGDKTEQHVAVAAYFAARAAAAGDPRQTLSVRLVPHVRFPAIMWPLPASTDINEAWRGVRFPATPHDSTALHDDEDQAAHPLDVTGVVYQRVGCCGFHKAADGSCVTVDFDTATARDTFCAEVLTLNPSRSYLRAHPIAPVTSTLFDMAWGRSLELAGEHDAGASAHIAKMTASRLGLAALAQQRWSASQFTNRWHAASDGRHARLARLLRHIARVATRAALERAPRTHRASAADTGAGAGAGAGAGTAAPPSTACYGRLAYWAADGTLQRSEVAPRIRLDDTARIRSAGSAAAATVTPLTAGAGAGARPLPVMRVVRTNDLLAEASRLSDAAVSGIEALAAVVTDGGYGSSTGDFWGDDAAPSLVDLTAFATVRTDVMTAFAPHFALAAEGASPDGASVFGGVTPASIHQPTVVRHVAVFRTPPDDGFAFMRMSEGFEVDLLVLPPPPATASSADDDGALVTFVCAALDAAARAGARHVVLPPFGWQPSSDGVGNAGAAAATLRRAVERGSLGVTVHVALPNTAAAAAVAAFAAFGGAA